MLSIKTIEMAIRALVEDQKHISYTETAISEIAGIASHRQGKEAAERGIKMWNEYEHAIMELEVERQLIRERENADKA